MNIVSQKVNLELLYNLREEIDKLEKENKELKKKLALKSKSKPMTNIYTEDNTNNDNR